METFDKAYWDDIWVSAKGGAMGSSGPNPYLLQEIADLEPGSALDAGCGAGAEAVWLATKGWNVTAADLAATALALGAKRAAAAGVDELVRWVEADLSTWEPDRLYDLVTTHYAHPAMPQLDFYRRTATWVAPGGTLLIVGHLHMDSSHAHASHGHESHGHGSHGHGGHDHNVPGHKHGDGGNHHQPPAEASATAVAITELFDRRDWRVDTASESHRTAPGPGGQPTLLHDVVVRATRLH